MVELGHPLSTHLMLAKNKYFIFILANEIDKTYQNASCIGYIASYNIHNLYNL